MIQTVLSPCGGLTRQPFAIAVTAIYMLSAVSLLLIIDPMRLRASVWLYVSVQVLLLWVWFSLHAKRLRDAGHRIRMAVGFTVINCLGMAVFVLMFGLFRLSPATLLAVFRLYEMVITILITVLEIALGLEETEAKDAVVEISRIIPYSLPLLSLTLALGHSIWAGSQPSRSQRA